jgi:AcrR family transcriptional regulator
MAVRREGAPDSEVPTREQILRAAGRLFYDRGYASTSMKMIAAGVGITPAALYWHFPSKAAILSASLHTETEGLVTAVEAAARDGTPTQRLRGYVREHVRQSITRAELGPFGANYGLQQLVKFLPPAEQEEIRDWLRRHAANLTRILEAGVAAGEFRPIDVVPTTYAVTTMCGYVTIWYRTGRRLSPEDVADQFADLALHMVIGRGDARSAPG